MSKKQKKAGGEGAVLSQKADSHSKVNTRLTPKSSQLPRKFQQNWPGYKAALFDHDYLLGTSSQNKKPYSCFEPLSLHLLMSKYSVIC